MHIFIKKNMRKKALALIGLHSKQWLAKEMEISVITLDKRITKDYWKESEKLLLEKIYQSEFK
jgi:hypothetical protein